MRLCHGPVHWHEDAIAKYGPDVVGDDVPVLVFGLADMRLAIGLSRVVEVCLRAQVTALPGVQPPITGVLRHRGRPLMVVELRRRLDLAPRPPGLFDHFVVVATVRRELALEVDRVIDVDSIPAAEIRGAPPSSRPLAGIVSLPQGVHYIVDLDALLELEQEVAFDAALSRAEASR